MAYYQNKWGDVFGNDLPTPTGRLVFPSLVTPSTLDKAKPKWTGALLFPKSDQRAWNMLSQRFYPHCQELIAQAFPGKTLETAPIGKSWIQDGDDPAPKSGKIYKSHAGHWVLKADAGLEYRPTIVDNQGKPLDPQALLAGMKCKFLVTPSAYQGFGGGIKYNLKQVMLIEDDGERLYSGPDRTSLMLADDESQFDENAGYQAPARNVQVQVPAEYTAQVAVPEPQQYVAPVAPQVAAPTGVPAPVPAPKRGRPAKAVVPGQATQAAAVAVAPQTAPNPSPGVPQPSVRSPGGVPQAAVVPQIAAPTPRAPQGFVTPPVRGAIPQQPMPGAVAGTMPQFQPRAVNAAPAGALKLV